MTSKDVKNSIENSIHYYRGYKMAIVAVMAGQKTDWLLASVEAKLEVLRRDLEKIEGLWSLDVPPRY